MKRKFKNITLSASEEKIEKARQRAKDRKSTLNQLFRDWLDSLTSENQPKYLTLMKAFKHVRSGRKFSREEMNER